MWADYANAHEVPGAGGGMRFNPDTGKNYIAIYGDAGLTGYGAEGGEWVSGAATGYMSWDPSSNRQNQGPYVLHDAAGNVTGRGNFTKAPNIEKTALGYLAALLSFGYGGAALAGGGAAPGGASAGTHGAFLGEGVASGVGAWDAALTTAGTTASSTAASVGATLKSAAQSAKPLLSALGLAGVAAASSDPAMRSTDQPADYTPLLLIGAAVVVVYLLSRG